MSKMNMDGNGGKVAFQKMAMFQVIADKCWFWNDGKVLKIAMRGIHACFLNKDSGKLFFKMIYLII